MLFFQKNVSYKIYRYCVSLLFYDWKKPELNLGPLPYRTWFFWTVLLFNDFVYWGCQSI